MRLAILGLCVLSLGCVNAQMFSVSGLVFPGPRGGNNTNNPNKRSGETGSKQVQGGLRPPQSRTTTPQPRPERSQSERINPAQAQAQQQLKPFSPDLQRPEFKRPAVFGPESEESEEEFSPRNPAPTPPRTTTAPPRAPVETRREAEIKREVKPEEPRQQVQEKPQRSPARPVQRPEESFEEEEEEIEQPKPKPRPVQVRRPAQNQAATRRQFKKPVSDDEDEAADIQVPVVVKRPQQPSERSDSRIKLPQKKFRPEEFEGQQKRRPIPQQDIEQSEEEEEEEPVDRLTLLLQDSKFSCAGKKDGYYADEGLNCEVFHYCMDKVRHSWLCPQGASFHQVHLICMPASNDNVCKRSSDYHFVNDYLYKPTSDDNSTYGDRYYPEDYEPGHPMNLEKVTGPKQQQRPQASNQPQRKIQAKKPYSQQFNAQDAFFNDDFDFRGGDSPFDRPQRPEERPQRPAESQRPQRPEERPQRQAEERPLRSEGQPPQRGPGPNQQRPEIRGPPPQKSDSFVPVYRPQIQQGDRRSDKAPEKRPVQPAEEEELESEEEE